MIKEHNQRAVSIFGEKKLHVVLICEKQHSAKKIVEKNKGLDFCIFSGRAIIPIAPMVVSDHWLSFAARCLDQIVEPRVVSDLEQVAKTAVSTRQPVVCS